MAMIVANNPTAQLALNQLNRNNGALRKALRKVSTGERITSAGDNASDYGISEKMRVQIRSLNQDIQNVQNGSTMLKIAHGGIENIVEELRTLKELAIDAANDSNTDADRQIIQKEFDQRKATIDEIATWTNYNTKPLLDGTYRRPSADIKNLDVIFVVDTTGSMDSFINRVANNLKTFTDSLQKMGKDWRLGLVQFGDVQIGEPTLKTSFKDGEFTSNAEEFINVLSSPHMYGGGDEAESGYDAIMDENVGVMSYDFRSDALKHVIVLSDASVHDAEDSYAKGRYSARDVIDALNSKNISLSGVIRPPANYVSRAEDSDDDDDDDYDDSDDSDGSDDSDDSDYVYSWLNIAHTDWSKLIEATGGVWYNISSNYGDSLAEYAQNVASSTKKDGIPLIVHSGSKANQATNFYINDMFCTSLGIDKATVTTRPNAKTAISIIDKAISYALDEATYIGAYLQRLEYTESNVTIANENVQNADSTIRDADMAKEMTEYTKYNVLSQAAQSILAQANQNLSSVLGLLQ